MDLDLFKIAIPSMGLLGAAFGIGLTIASDKLAVEVDPRVEEIDDALPGANCGACGEPGCNRFAEAVVNGEAEVDGCPVGGSELADEIADIMGVETGSSVKNVARVLCCGGDQETFKRSKYKGIKTCKAADNVAGGSKSCVYGCLGFGDCAAVCPFDAIEMDENGLPKIIDEKCTGCNNCVEECPKDVIILAAEDREVHIKCRSQNEGKEVKEVCKMGCIACGVCVEKCPVDTIEMKNNLAILDYEECINCGACVKACPMETIEHMETDVEETDIEPKKDEKQEEKEEKPDLKLVSSQSDEETDAVDENKCSIQITDECSGCTVCVEECPVDAITGEAGERHEIDPEGCIECENCVDVCPTEAINVE